ncbi:MAG: class I SAM-dependent methyltransferase [Chloroflexi bacterium]|nr:class I SAM-dependent methyltransferase [Chloroflexota bacterium]
MKLRRRFNGTFLYLFAHWPLFFGLYTGMVTALIVIGISAQQGWLSYIPIATAVFLILIYFLAISIWAAHQLYDQGGLTPHHVLFELGQIQATDTFAFLDLGYRRHAMALSRRLTTGRIIVIDVYNPQWVLSQALARWRTRMPTIPNDPRLSWRDGRISLLPIPNESVPMVILPEIASQFWQSGDRLILLKEIHRILTPNGRLLMAEKVRSQTNYLVMGLNGFSLDSVEQWRELISSAGFIIRREHSLNGLIHCFRADKPTSAEAKQLELDLAYDQGSS